MSFTLTTEKDEWKIAMGVVTGTTGSVWVAFNKNFDHVQADTLDHLYIAIDQFEHPEEYE